MTVNQRELLSALVDGQLSTKELDQALSLISTDPLARQDFLRYQHTSDFIHGYTRRTAGTPVDLTQRIALALENEPTHQKVRSKASIIAFPTKIWRQAGGFAVAASVGALAVIGVMNQPATFEATPTTVAANDVATEQTLTVASSVLAPQNPSLEAAAASAVSQTIASSANHSQVNRWTVGGPEVEARLNNYLVDHSEYASGTGMFSYGRVVSYGSEQ